jgi:hypothetical protein
MKNRPTRVLTVKQAHHDAVVKRCDDVVAADRKRLAVLALGRRDADGQIVHNVPYNRPKEAHVGKREVALALGVANQSILFILVRDRELTALHGR